MSATETFRIPKHRRHVPTARQQVRKALADWGITDELADDVTLSANELLTNAVTHCRVSCAQVRVTIALRGPYLLLEVHDPDRDRLPELRDSGPDGEGGRGLALVGRLAHGWGHTRQRHTKCVWARFMLPEGLYVPSGS
ncbi:anti-sigma regulatory factor (Ser/Thr protein kinase) [Streptomyces sp. LBL]|uniref:ATP-binding protein n=1 Tax=Streptomyces sp. LBL TaxID=2940562 RepID=UPI002473D283|nr:ATP-binding protein [Streptomyces sp. LBL]MDH6628918.1 anti-sigma regulatory factor (Ser/Thr protein kinase) [Streptomyces sp. LBL]